MFYHLFSPYANDHLIFNLFRYVTFRSIYAAVTALIISFIFGGRIIKLIKNYQITETIRKDGPKSHYAKEGTPSMGGLIIILASVLPTLLWADLSNMYVIITVVVTLLMGGIGFVDDYIKIFKRNKKGLHAKTKLAGQLFIGAALGLVLYYYSPVPEIATKTFLPFFKDYFIDFGIFYLPFVILVIAGTSNATNFTDGLDGLLTGIASFSVVSFGVLTYILGRIDWTNYLQLYYFPGIGELAVFCAALFGALLGFLWYNCKPADIFMGDTGSMAIGGALGCLAILSKHEIFLLISGGVMVMEVISVMIQVLVFKKTKKRVFLMAPIHHHFELKGWKETKVVTRFWILSILFMLIALSTLKIR